MKILMSSMCLSVCISQPYYLLVNAPIFMKFSVKQKFESPPVPRKGRNGGHQNSYTFVMSVYLHVIAPLLAR